MWLNTCKSLSLQFGSLIALSYYPVTLITFGAKVVVNKVISSANTVSGNIWMVVLIF